MTVEHTYDDFGRLHVTHLTERATMKAAFTPIEQRLDNLLNDGMEHTSSELLRCIDDLASLDTLSYHMNHLRDKLEPRGLSVVTRIRNKVAVYYKVRRISNA